MKTEESARRFKAMLEEEKKEDRELYVWMSFCDPDKPEGQQFLGVIITRAPGLAHAIEKTHALGINPGGEIQSQTGEAPGTPPEHLDRLLSKAELKEMGYI